jgi:L,D-transpeptidase YcbB
MIFYSLAGLERAMRKVLGLALLLLTLAFPAWSSPQDVVAGLYEEQAQAVEWRDVTIDLNKLKSYYGSDDAVFIWVADGALTVSGSELVAAIAKADSDGLNSKDYTELAFEALAQLSGEEDEAGAELALSQSYLKLARDLSAGRTSPSLNATSTIIERKVIDPKKWLDIARNSGTASAIQALRPRHPQYGKLRQLLATYRNLESLGGWEPIGAGPALKPGMRDGRVAAMRASLAARGYKGLSSADASLYDPSLLNAVKTFQLNNGVEDDGVVGKGTVAILNLPVEERIKQIIVNMERWRWLPNDLGARHVLVNQAGFEMFLTDRGKTIDRRRVIVGKPFHATPMFSDRIGYAEFNPTWTVSPDIAKAEFLPKLIEDPGYLAANDYVIYSGWAEGAPQMDPYNVDWRSIKGKFPYRIVQQPGAKNALGVVKFMFPNKFNIYLHDTPSRQLFAKTGRAFSHGCIRVHKPMEFAEKLFGLDQKLSRAQLDAIVDSGQLQRVALKSKVPVHLTYFTIWIGDEGRTSFFADIYGRDSVVSDTLFNQV